MATHRERRVDRLLFLLEVRVGEQTFPLRRHQTLYFDATLAHQLRNLGKEPAKLFMVTSPPML